MQLEFWTILWKSVFIFGVALFAMLAVAVAIGGAMNIAKLLRTLRMQQNADHGYSDSELAGLTDRRER